MSLLDQPKTIRAWTFYDWANSAYSLIITSAIFPAYYTAVVPEHVSLGSWSFHRSALASYAIAFSFLLIAALSPLLSSLADYRGNKKAFMRFFCYLGSLACILMFFFDEKTLGPGFVWYGILCSVIASVGYCGSIVFYNAFLPEIASKAEQDKVSAQGFSMGYIGSVVLMLLCFAFILGNTAMEWGLGTLPVRMSFLAVGLWWIGFAQIPLRRLPETPRHSELPVRAILAGGYRELGQVWKNLTHTPALKKFLLAFFFYNMGVQTVMYMATYFASDELHMETNQLLAVVLIIQLVAIAGARLFARISQAWGNHRALIALVLIWIGICMAAYFVQTVMAFFALSFTVGLVMGGIQSLSRSSYAKLLPATEDTASYFSFFDVCEKFGIVIGTLTFGMLAEGMGGMRASALGLGLYFVVGLFLLLRMKREEFPAA
jgi:UMF1 family MFS transporter